MLGCPHEPVYAVSRAGPEEFSGSDPPEPDPAGEDGGRSPRRGGSEADPVEARSANHDSPKRYAGNYRRNVGETRRDRWSIFEPNDGGAARRRRVSRADRRWEYRGGRQ